MYEPLFIRFCSFKVALKLLGGTYLFDKSVIAIPVNNAPIEMVP
jgi:hypothetical protein